MKNIIKKWRFWVIIIVVIIAIVIIYNGTKSSDTQTVDISSITIQEGYEDISINADAWLVTNGYVNADIVREDATFEALPSLIEFVISDENIVKVNEIRFDDSQQYQYTNTVTCELEGVNNGTTTGFFQTKDGNVKSGTINITVTGVESVSETTSKQNITDMDLEDAVNYVIETSNAEKNEEPKIYQEGNTEVDIYLKTQVGLSNSGTVSSMHLDAKRILEQLQNRSDIDTIVLSWDMQSTDVYGNNKDINVMVITMSKETLNKINFDNFNIENFPDVADEYYLAAQLKQ